MSDCRVPMMSYPKELLRSEDNKNELPPIPDGWMAVSAPNSCLTIEQTTYSGSQIRIDGLNISMFNSEQAFDPRSKVDVLVLVREHK